MPDGVRANKIASAAWKRIVPQLLKLNLLTRVDSFALEGLCMAYSRAVEADKSIEKDGLMVKTAWGTLTANPAVSISKNSWIEVRKFAQEFGLSPSSRTRVRAESNSNGEGGAKDEAEGFLFGGAKVVGRIG